MGDIILSNLKSTIFTIFKVSQSGNPDKSSSRDLQRQRKFESSS